MIYLNYINLQHSVSEMGKQLKDADAIKAAKALSSYIKNNVDENNIKKESEEVEKISKKVEKVADQQPNEENNNTDAQAKSKKEESIGVNKEGKPLVTSKEQEDKSVASDIKDNKEFFAPLAQAVGLDGESLKSMIVNMINESFKEETKDKDGNTVYKWKQDIAKNTLAAWASQGDHEKQLIEGMGAMLCGAMLIGHKGLTESVTQLLTTHGFSKKDYMNALKK